MNNLVSRKYRTEHLVGFMSHVMSTGVPITESITPKVCRIIENVW